MKNLILLSLIFIFGCTKPPQDELMKTRRFSVSASGKNPKIYINGSLMSYNIPTGYQDIANGAVLRVTVDTTHYGTNIVPCEAEIKVYNGHNSLLNEVHLEQPANIDVSTTIE